MQGRSKNCLHQCLTFFKNFLQSADEKISREALIEITIKEFPCFSTTELECIRPKIMSMIEALDVNNAEFDDEYNRIISGTIIYFLAFERSKYSGSIYQPGSCIDMSQVFEICNLSEGMPIKNAILQVGKNALEGKFTKPIDEFINYYFNCFFDGKTTNPLRNVLLKQFVKNQDEEVTCKGILNASPCS